MLVLGSSPAGSWYPFLAQEWSSFNFEDSSALQEQPLSFAAVAEAYRAFQLLHLQIGHALEQAACASSLLLAHSIDHSLPILSEVDLNVGGLVHQPVWPLPSTSSYSNLRILHHVLGL